MEASRKPTHSLKTRANARKSKDKYWACHVARLARIYTEKIDVQAERSLKQLCQQHSCEI
jgi:hypothetical protein